MAAKPLPDQALLLKLLRYEPETGKLYWRERPVSMFSKLGYANTWNKKHSGREAGRKPTSGRYSYVSIGRIAYLCHRIIWKMVMGDDPQIIDHIDGNRQNNRWENLRDVTFCENMLNQSARNGGTSWKTGVCWSEKYGIWRAYITKSGKTTYLGTFKSEDDAIRARSRAERILGFHPNHGRKRA